MRHSKYAAEALDITPADVWPLRKIGDGAEIGIEIECEGRGLAGVEKWWTTHADGSLRNNGIEYVLAKPIQRKNVEEALQYLSLELQKMGAKVNETYRTSVHVHVNAMDMKFRHIFNEICLYMLFEDLLVELCGKERIGNLFCLRAKDAEALVDSIRMAIQQGQYNGFKNNEMFKYGAVNIAALGHYGSLEFRAFRGTVDPNLINDWVEILLDIKDAALKYNDPQQICVEFSQLGPRKFVEKIFKPKNQRVLFGFKNLDQRLYDGVRMIQEIAYAIPNWNVVEDQPAAQVPVYGGDAVEKPRRGGPRVGARAKPRVGRVDVDLENDGWRGLIRDPNDAGLVMPAGVMRLRYDEPAQDVPIGFRPMDVAVDNILDDQPDFDEDFPNEEDEI